MPSLRRDDGSTSMATVLLATVAAPNGIPCMVRTIANISSVPAPIYSCETDEKGKEAHHQYPLAVETVDDEAAERAYQQCGHYIAREYHSDHVLVAWNSESRYSGSNGVRI